VLPPIIFNAGYACLVHLQGSICNGVTESFHQMPSRAFWTWLFVVCLQVSGQEEAVLPQLHDHLVLWRVRCLHFRCNSFGR
jgi:hypothetical protein